MRRPLAIVLFLALLLQTFFALGVIAFYNTQQDYVAATLCENKARPELHCQGKCFLKKKLKDAQQEGGQTKKGSEKQDLVLALPVLNYSLAIMSHCAETPMESGFQPSQYAFAWRADCFHPPAA